jgi:hypothetical protein
LYEIAEGDDEAVGVYGDELCGVKMSMSHPMAIVGHREMVPRHLPRAAKITKVSAVSTRHAPLLVKREAESKLESNTTCISEDNSCQLAFIAENRIDRSPAKNT